MTADYSWIPEGLYPIAFRLARADQATFEVMRHSLKWSEAGGAGAVTLKQVYTSDNRVNSVVADIRPVPAAIPLAFSEAIHHLRAAIDTALYWLVERELGPLDADTARSVNFPIVSRQRELTKWYKKVTDAGLSVLAKGSSLGERVESLQPIRSSDRVPSIRRSSLAKFGMDVVHEHPLLLLQKYSNDDKHNGIRAAVGRHMTVTGDMPVTEQKLEMRPLKVGDVIASTKVGQPLLVESYPAVLVERPFGSAWVSPGGELSQLWRYVSDIAIPTLVLGAPRTHAFPAKLDLKSLERAAAQLIEEGNPAPAEERFEPYLRESQQRSAGSPIRQMPH